MSCFDPRVAESFVSCSKQMKVCEYEQGRKNSQTDGSKASVIVRECPHCANRHDIIATTADNTKKDNLLELRECNWQ